jgi:hypothetical protein
MLDPMLLKELDQCLSWCVASESLVSSANALVLDVSTTPRLIWVLGLHVGSDISGRGRCCSRKMPDFVSLLSGELPVSWMGYSVERGLVIVTIDDGVEGPAAGRPARRPILDPARCSSYPLAIRLP